MTVFQSLRSKTTILALLLEKKNRSKNVKKNYAIITIEFNRHEVFKKVSASFDTPVKWSGLWEVRQNTLGFYFFDFG